MSAPLPASDPLFDAPEMLSVVDVRVEPVRGFSLTTDDWIAWIENDRVGAYAEARGYRAALTELEQSTKAALDEWEKIPDEPDPAAIAELRVAREQGALGDLLGARARLDWK